MPRKTIKTFNRRDAKAQRNAKENKKTKSEI
jgi:hypothetical protein